MSGPLGFGSDADLTHEWARRYRIPIISCPYPVWSYEVALCVSATTDPVAVDVYGAVLPTEEEAAVIGSVIDFRRSFYYDQWARRMLTRPFDVDSSTNTLVLGKITPGKYRQIEGWRHRLASWRSQVWSSRPAGALPLDLHAVLDLHFGDRPRWVQWKSAHRDLFPAGGPS